MQEISHSDGNSVRASRAGDAFHYRWAAKKVLSLIAPSTKLRSVVIEGLSPHDGPIEGEEKADVTEHWDGDSGAERIVSQLKHSTNKTQKEFVASELSDCLSAFSEIFQEARVAEYTVKFQIVSNRPFAESFVKILADLKCGTDAKECNQVSLKTLKTHTKLSGNELQAFCSSVELLGEQGNYLVQEAELGEELSKLIDKPILSPELGDFINFVAEHALPGNEKHITKADVLRKLGVENERELFPAPSEIALPEQVYRRVHYDILADKVVSASCPIIVLAEGGVGKTVAVSSLAQHMPTGSATIVYDCFGSGLYRNIAFFRHKPIQAFQQIINECAQLLLCSPLLRADRDETQISRVFFSRIESAVEVLRAENPEGLLVVVIDAGDNASIAARLHDDNSFVDVLLGLPLPEGVRLVVSARPERLDLLQLPSPSRYTRFELPPFDAKESHSLLISYFPEATAAQGEEFRYLTSGNPRLQRTSLELNKGLELEEFLRVIGPNPSALDDQFASLLECAVEKIESELGFSNDKAFEKICKALSTLPPPIPIEVLAGCANVVDSAVRTFATEMGTGLQLRESTIHFKDEPTETWFRKRFRLSNSDAEELLGKVSRQAETIPYAASIMPQLLFQAGRYDEVVSLALQEDSLRNLNPSDRKEILANRLRFSLSAALKNKKWKDACKLALRAGEEFAGEQRRLNLFKDNVDLVAYLSDAETVSDLALRRKLKGSWEGSSNIYSASLFTKLPSDTGELRSYLRCGIDWLELQVDEERKARRESRDFSRSLDSSDFCELFRATLALDGVEALSDELKRWNQANFIYEALQELCNSLIDQGEYDCIDKLSKALSWSLPGCLAITHALSEVGRFPCPAHIRTSFYLLTSKRHSLVYRNRHSLREPEILLPILSLAEAAFAAGFEEDKILRIIRVYRGKFSRHDLCSDFSSTRRVTATRSLGLELVLIKKEDFTTEELIEKLRLQEEEEEPSNEKVGRNLQALLPLYIERAKIISGNLTDLESRLTTAVKRAKSSSPHEYSRFDLLKFERIEARLAIATLVPSLPLSELNSLKHELFKEERKFPIDRQVRLYRASFHAPGMKGLQEDVEKSLLSFLGNPSPEDEPETIASYYVGMTRACLAGNRADAHAFFDKAVDAVSRFGDEGFQRWRVHQTLIGDISKGSKLSHEAVFRVTRVFELLTSFGGNRESHFTDSLLRSLAQLNPQSSVAVVSRWVEQDFGYLNGLLCSLLLSLLESGNISCGIAWSFGGFLGLDTDRELLWSCIDELLDIPEKEKIFQVVSRDFRLANKSIDSLYALKAKGKEVSLSCDDLEARIKQLEYEDQKSAGLKEIALASSTIGSVPAQDKDSNKFSSGIAEIAEKGHLKDLFKFLSPDRERAHINQGQLLSEFWENLPYSRTKEILGQIGEHESGCFYDVKSLLGSMPKKHRERPSVQSYWSEFRRGLARRYALPLVNEYTRNQLHEILRKNGESKWDVLSPILDGLGELKLNEDAESLFELAEFLSGRLAIEEQHELLDYGISRFELQLPPVFGEGQWSVKFIPPESLFTCLSRFLWHLLGNPDSKIRWQAAHSVVRLNIVEENEILNELHKIPEQPTLRCFQHRDYFPYFQTSLHFLLLSQDRASMENAKALTPYASIYLDLATRETHAAINQIAARIALRIEKSVSGVYVREQIQKLHSVNCSSLEFAPPPSRQCGRHDFWQRRKGDEVILGVDFEEYWLNPVARIFGLSATEASNRLMGIVRSQFNIDLDGRFIVDNRRDLLNSLNSRGLDYSSHGQYPKIWDLQFYVAFHSVQILAAQLIRESPLVDPKESYHGWSEWLAEHGISRPDGYWLSEVVSPLPVHRREWVYKPSINENWCWDISTDDFFDCLIQEQDELIFEGRWSDNSQSYEERIEIDSRLVSRSSSKSLLTALTQVEWINRWDLIQESSLALEALPLEFHLRSLVEQIYKDPRSDKTDPRVDEIDNLFHSPTEELFAILKLKEETPPISWVNPTDRRISMKFDQWNEVVDGRAGGFSRGGKQMKISIEAIKMLLSRTDSNLVVSMAIFREKQRYGKSRYSEFAQPYSKHFILSSDGTIRNFRDCSQLW